MWSKSVEALIFAAFSRFDEDKKNFEEVRYG